MPSAVSDPNFRRHFPFSQTQTQGEEILWNLIFRLRGYFVIEMNYILEKAALGADQPNGVNEDE